MRRYASNSKFKIYSDPLKIGSALALTVALTACVSQKTTTPASIEQASKAAPSLCTAMGPQSPRDISNPAGSNPVTFTRAPDYRNMNLCNIHTHTNAEHKGPGFNVYKGDGDHGGYGCNAADSLTDFERRPYSGAGAFNGAVPGDTLEVHWVHSSCDIAPGEGLGSCLSETCADPLLRVETQVFLVVNDANALDFTSMDLSPNKIGGHYQAKFIPSDTGTPLTYLGSTTGPKYDQSVCSPAEVTWSVRPICAKLDIGSLHRWVESGNVFGESKSHGVRQLVTAPQLLSAMD